MDLYLLSFNNYYNRQVKKFDTFAEYEPYVLDVVENYNFVAGDGVNTVLKAVNYDGETQPDYVLIVDGTTIKSRWFIIDSDFIRKGQFKITLHRDLIADSYSEVINAPCYIEKATLNNDDPAVYNKENQTVNQIKTQETKLSDETGTAWIVGYIPKDSYKADTTVNSDFIDAGNPDIKVDSITNWTYYKYSNLSGNSKKYMSDLHFTYVPEMSFGLETNYPPYIHTKAIMPIKENGDYSNTHNDFYSSTHTYGIWKIYLYASYTLNTWENYTHPFSKVWLGKQPSLSQKQSWFAALGQKVLEKIKPNMAAANAATKTYFNTNMNTDVGADISNLNSKTIYDTSTKTMYKINIVKERKINTIKNDNLKPIFDKIFANSSVPEYYYIKDGNDTVKNSFVNKSNYLSTQIDYEGYEYTIKLEQQTINIKTTVLGQKNRNHLSDAPYDMFCMPYSEDFVFYDGTKKYSNNKFAALNMAVAVGIGSGLDDQGKEVAGNVYDIQLLPYCPVRSAIKEAKFDIAGIPHNNIVSPDGKTVFSVMIWCDQSNFTFDINHTINIDNYKESNELDVYRLCSPNYASVFEFSPAKNKGVSKFNVDITYKPFNPYIHINPDFKGLYGADFDDSRGLILSGDFSITQLNSAYANFELQNKNFEASFQREVLNLDRKQEYQRTSEIANAVTGSFTGLGAGAVMGSMFGPVGTAIGATLGGAASAGAGAADILINDKLRAENKSFMEDMHEYQIGNIQAIPYTISKTTALTANNKIFPFIEYYTCTPTERQAYRNKIKYTGMTVNRIGTIAEFKKAQPTFIKGQLIRMEGIDEDFHFINSLAEELNKGIYI